MEQFTDSPQRRRSEYEWLLIWTGVYLAALMAYSQTLAYTGDEGFHLLTDQLIRRGMRPYLDFCYPQASFNNYWNVLWMSLFGESWRAVHAVATVVTAAAVFLMADYVYRRFPVPRWRLSAALLVLVAVGLNQIVDEYGVLAQAYGMCLLGVTAAFRCALPAIGRRRPWLAIAAGFFAGIAAASSLLAAAAVPIVVIWIFFKSHSGNRWWKAACAAFGAAIPFAPMIILFAQGPVQVWFNLVQYHLFFRQLYWSETTSHDLEVVTSWINSGQGLITGLLAAGGVWYLARRAPWPLKLRSEFYLCAWLGGGLLLEVARAHPTFPRYFLVTVPFLGPLAAVGVYALCTRLLDRERPLLPLAPLAFLMLLSLGRSLYDRREMHSWPEYQTLARRVLAVTPRGADIWADEQMYFMTRIKPMPGLEFGYSHKVQLPQARMKLLHIVNDAEVTRRVKARNFATVFSCDDDEISDMGFNKLYSHKFESNGCLIFWGPPPADGESAVAEPKLPN